MEAFSLKVVDFCSGKLCWKSSLSYKENIRYFGCVPDILRPPDEQFPLLVEENGEDEVASPLHQLHLLYLVHAYLE